MKLLRFALAGLMFGAFISAQATVRIFCGLDAVQFASDPRPNTNAAFAQFVVVAASVNSISVANFDELADGTVTGPIASNANIASTVNLFGGVESNDDVILGFNTSPSAGKHYRMGANDTAVPASVNFSFDTPINAFGAFFTGVGTSAGNTYIEWTNSTGVQKLDLQPFELGSVQFCGFIDLGEAFTSVRVVMEPENGSALDVIGIDDLTYSNCNPVPEPGTIAALSLGAVALIRRRRK